MIRSSTTLNTNWNEWKSGEYETFRDTTFLQIIFDKNSSYGLRIRLVFEEDFDNQHIINIAYQWIPGNFQMIFDQIGKKVKSIVAEGTESKGCYLVTFQDGTWFRI